MTSDGAFGTPVTAEQNGVAYLVPKVIGETPKSDDRMKVLREAGINISKLSTLLQSNPDLKDIFEETDPAQVVVIHYNYENLGYEDKDGIMDGLFIEPYSAIDSDGNMCKTYPVEVEYAQETPVGAKCAASIAFGLIKEGSPVTIPIEMYDGNGKKQTAKYVLEF